MTRAEALGRLLELVIPGGKEPEPEQPSYPCVENCERTDLQNSFTYRICEKRWSDLQRCDIYLEWSAKVDLIHKNWQYVHYQFMKKAVLRFHIKHYIKGFSQMYIANNEDVQYVLEIFRYNRNWKAKLKPILPLLYKRSKATWPAMKVTLALNKAVRKNIKIE